MKHLLFILLTLPFILAPSACVDVKAEPPTEEPWVIHVTPTPTPQPGTMNHEDEMRFTQVLILVNQECTDSDGIDADCKSAGIKCYEKDIWKPTNAVLKCLDEWKGKP